MRWLKILLAVTGILYLAYAASNIVLPTSYFLGSDAPKNAVDAVRVIGMAYGALGVILLGMWWVTDRLAIRIVAAASMLYNAGFAAQAALQGSASTDPFHQLSLAVAVGNGLVAVLYAVLLYRESQTARA